MISNEINDNSGIPIFFVNPSWRRKFSILAIGLPLAAASMLAVSSEMSAARTLQFAGNSLKPIEITPEASTGLECIYVLYDLNNVTVSFTSDTGTPVKWYRFSNMGGGYAEEISGVSYSGNVSSITNPQGDMGYIVECDGRQYCFWIVDYHNHRFSLKSASLSESDCSSVTLSVDGEGAPIHYFTINGQQKVLSREITVTYNTLSWDSKNLIFNQVRDKEDFASMEGSLRISPAPLCATTFEITGDRFLNAWKWGESYVTENVQPVTVESYAFANQQASSADSDKSNVIKVGDGEALGGSAPVTIDFSAYVSDAVIHNEWQMTHDATFGNIEYRFNDQDVSYTFMEEGTFFMRFVGSNSDGSCESVSDAFTIVVGSSELLCPNAFSPDDDGINDLWKVAYRSLIEFECWIFDRYGAELAHFKNPDEGWDGKRGGKKVPSGVYYYVIRAKGADGKEYKKNGDINILRHKSANDKNGAMP